MKKKTKRGIGRIVVVFLKIIFIYPFKGIWFLTKKIRQVIQSNKEKLLKQQNEAKRPKVQPQYLAFTEIKALQGTFSVFEHKLLSNKSSIGIILGARGTGKSALGMRLLENYAAKTTKNIYALGFQQESLPEWIHVVQTIDEIHNNAVILIDEGGIEFSSRKAMTSANQLLSQLLLIARHKDLSVMFITQNSANLEINAIRQADYLLLKPSSLLQKDFERKKIKEIYEEVQQEFDILTKSPGLTYVYADNYRGFVANGLPGFWSEKVSKGYAQK